MVGSTKQCHAPNASADHEQALLRRIDVHLFQVLMFRRLRLPLPLPARQRRCGRPLYVRERVFCEGEVPQWRVLGQGVANAMLRDFDLVAPDPRDQRLLEILADGLPLFGGAQLAVDMLSPLHCDGSPHLHAANVDGAVLAETRRRKERTNPELVGPRRRAWLVVLARETGQTVRRNQEFP